MGDGVEGLGAGKTLLRSRFVRYEGALFEF